MCVCVYIYIYIYKYIFIHLLFYFQMTAFNAFVMIFILIDSLVVGLLTIEKLKEDNAVIFSALDVTFLVVYTLEFCLKVYADRKEYWKSGYNLFDFGLLVLTYLQLMLENLHVDESFLKIVRLLRGNHDISQHI